jgi:hypothetical protein
MCQNKDKNLTKNDRNYIPRRQKNAKQSMPPHLHQNHSKCETENSIRLCSNYTEKKGWQKCRNQVQFYTRTIDQFSISQCQIRTKTWPKTVAVTLKKRKKLNCKHRSTFTDRQNVRECDTKGWQNFCIQVQFYTRTIDQFCIKKCEIRTKTWPKTVAIVL